MMSKNIKKSIRPQIKTIDYSLSNSDFERFQNNTLRPILKLQNDLILVMMLNYLDAKKRNNHCFETPELKQYLRDLIQKDTRLKLKLRTLIIAHFTVEEYQEYIKEKKENNKRITTMIIERILDNLQSR